MCRSHGVQTGSLVGLDEAGRGPLAGPLVASAVILHQTDFQVPIDDSKRLSPKARERAYQAILLCSDIGIGWTDPQEIDHLGIQKAWSCAMARAVQRLLPQARLFLLDGHRVFHGCPKKTLTIIGGGIRKV